MNIRDYLDRHILVADGAMGTYFGEIMGNTLSCEMATIEYPDVIRRIHREYIKAGAKLIRTNTFSANTISMNINRETLEKLIRDSFRIATDTARRDAFIGCSIGPIHESHQKKRDGFDYYPEYKFIVDTFLDEGGEIFVFETFGSTDYLKEITEYIKSVKEDAFIITQFAVMADGYTRRGVNINNIIEDIKEMGTIDVYGFNCGSGPAHIYNLLKKMDIFKDNIVSVLPNAGYPEMINGRMVYVNNPGYFCEKILDIVKLGARIVGGCCGTTPEHIKEIVRRLNRDLNIDFEIQPPRLLYKKNKEAKPNIFRYKLDNDEFAIAVELDPPFDSDLDKLMRNAEICKQNGIDVVTIADSPRGMARVDSLMVASKIYQDIGIETMPHLCCRDKNVNALKSGILGAHINGVRNILAMTGDPVLDIDSVATKSVFNMNSYELINMIDNMNKDIFKNDEIMIGGALNLNVKNKDAQLGRMKRKNEKGAEFYLTQPIYDMEVAEYLKTMERGDEKILAGIMPIVSYKNAQFLNNELPGIKIPEEHIERFRNIRDREKSVETGIEIACDMIEELKAYVDGIYFIAPFGRMDIIAEIIRRTRI